jgi:hypothetical protein
MLVQAAASLAGAGILHACDWFITPPPRLPDLFTLLITAYSCAHFLAAYMASAIPSAWLTQGSKTKQS